VAISSTRMKTFSDSPSPLLLTFSRLILASEFSERSFSLLFSPGVPAGALVQTSRADRSSPVVHPSTLHQLEVASQGAHRLAAKHRNVAAPYSLRESDLPVLYDGPT
jgi:hypothetical protein